jgi:L-alanine-DL-glutamate epimerase-like enolase superfamily enzyme
MGRQAMKVQTAEIWRLALPLRWEFKHALAARRVTENIVLKIVLDNGCAGYGECVPREYVTGETAQSAIESIRDRWLPMARGQTFGSVGDLKAFLGSCALEGASGCAFELALADGVTRAFGETPHGLIGPARRSAVRYSAVIPAVGQRWLGRLALAVRALRFRTVKIKVGTGEDDVARVRRLRSVVGERVEIRVDANGAWDPDVALKRIHELQNLGVLSVEEPTHPHDMDALAYTASRSPLPICVDESLATLADARQLIERRACHIFNLRLSKCGGLLNCLRIAEMADNAGIGYQVGCQVGESGILSAAGRCLLMRLDGALQAEGSYWRLLLREDLTRPAVRFGLGGCARGLRGPGLGVGVRQDALRRFAVSHAIFAVN